MIAAVLGTTAELIKMSPVLTRLVERGAAVEIWYTAMHAGEFNELRQRLVPDIPMITVGNPKRTKTVSAVTDVPRWLTEIGLAFRALRRGEGSESPRSWPPRAVLVLGDTFTTVAGAIWGRRLGSTVVHIEAGARSGSLLSPFPEEIDRRLVARLADIHYAPSQEEVRNLGRRKGRIVDTGGNTVVDALRLFLPEDTPESGDFGLVTLHRFEFMRKPGDLGKILELCNEAARTRPIRFMTGEHGRERLREHGLIGLFDDRFTITRKVSYPEFVTMLAQSAFVLTDSGGLQQECAYLGVPCLVHRARTESSLGLGRNVVLGGLSVEAARRFLEHPERFRSMSEVDLYHPSDVIVEDLESIGLIGD